jgi:hypothetical protein
MPVHGHPPHANSYLSNAALAIPKPVPRDSDELFVKAACLVLLPAHDGGKQMAPKGCIGFVKFALERRKSVEKWKNYGFERANTLM